MAPARRSARQPDRRCRKFLAPPRGLPPCCSRSRLSAASEAFCPIIMPLGECRGDDRPDAVSPHRSICAPPVLSLSKSGVSKGVAARLLGCVRNIGGGDAGYLSLRCRPTSRLRLRPTRAVRSASVSSRTSSASPSSRPWNRPVRVRAAASLKPRATKKFSI